MTSSLDTLVHTLMYEGYVLWPYRRSALKNRQRWTFGGVHPRAFSEAGGGTDRAAIRAELLVQGASPSVDVELRFLQVLDRLVAEIGEDGERRYADEVRVRGERVMAWEEARERRVSVPEVPLARDVEREVPVEIPPGEDVEMEPGEPRDPGDPTDAMDRARPRSAVIRRWAPLDGMLTIRSARLAPDLARLTLTVENRSGWPGVDRAEALRRTLAAATLVVAVRDGAFVSLLDPPAPLAGDAAACRNEGVWPVLVGAEGATDVMLVSPIILYDYPRIAPESVGDQFDATEIDQMLVLNTLALSDAEKDEIRATDPRVREILDRTEALDPARMLNLAGALRDVRPVDDEPRWPVATDGGDLRTELEEPGVQEAAVLGGVVGPGARVLIAPRPGGDVFDTVLAGRVGIVESVEHDIDGRILVALTIEDDPGRDLGVMRMPGHRFFYAPEELEALSSPAGEAR